MADLMKFEEDSVQDHTHIDPGHTHTDNGHSHSYIDQFFTGPNYPGGTQIDAGPYAWSWSDSSKTSNIDKADLSIEGTGLGGIDPATAKISGETRPKNYWVQYIMKVDYSNNEA